MEHVNDTSNMLPSGKVTAANAPSEVVINIVTPDHMPLSELSALEEQILPATAAYEPPQGEIEEELARIWSEALHVFPVGRNNGFFELGGDSLSATTILHKIQDIFKVELPLRTIFELQTIKAMAEIIDGIYE